jgi:hypothetical protein
MDETTASEEASENAQEQNAELEKTASAAGNQVRQTIQTAWQDAKNKISELEIYVRDSRPEQSWLPLDSASSLVCTCGDELFCDTGCP